MGHDGIIYRRQTRAEYFFFIRKCMQIGNHKEAAARHPALIKPYLWRPPTKTLSSFRRVKWKATVLCISKKPKFFTLRQLETTSSGWAYFNRDRSGNSAHLFCFEVGALARWADWAAPCLFRIRFSATTKSFLVVESPPSNGVWNRPPRCPSKL